MRLNPDCPADGATALTYHLIWVQTLGISTNWLPRSHRLARLANAMVTAGVCTATAIASTNDALAVLLVSSFIRTDCAVHELRQKATLTPPRRDLKHDLIVDGQLY
jgi:hypothetical protein